MIDTVVLIVHEGNYKILDPKKFIPSTTVLDSPISFGAKAFVKCVQNTSEDDYVKGLSSIKLTIIKRAIKGGFMKPLKIEFSAPKLLFGNNVNELSDEDFNLVIDTLKKRLLAMGIEVSRTSLLLAKVSVINYSKNIELPPFVTPSMILKELAKVNMTKRLSLDKTFFQNDGHALTFYSKSYTIVIYDKVKDVQKTTGVKVDKDPTIFQQDLFSDNKLPMEILRIEIRLNNYRKIESLLKIIEKPMDRSFVNMFKSETAKQIIQYYWVLITDGINKFLFLNDEGIYITAEAIHQANPKLSAIKLLSIIGYIQFAKQDSGRSLRKFIESHYTCRTWFRLNKVLKETLKNKRSLKYLSFITEITEAIEKFKTFTIDIRQLDDK